MGLGSSQPIADQRVYAQDTAPTDERDGILWVDTSLSPRETFVFSTTTDSWEPVAITDHGQLENSPTETGSTSNEIGRVSGFTLPQVNLDAAESEVGNYGHFLTGIFSELHLSCLDSTGRDGTIHYQDGGTKTVSVAAGGSKWVSVDSTRPISFVSSTVESVVVTGYNMVDTHPHTHSITP